uniref:Hemocyanin subunit b n=1 Tax=Euphrynichus bacillifer TaxID=317672 RepID=G8YZR2_9ARAC|nr:hemocyanin subunit b [Euphrynichus bacillifer]
MPSSAAEKQRRILPLFQKIEYNTSNKFSILVRDDPRFSGLGVLGRGQLFCCFHEEHLKEATKLYELLIAAETFDEFLDLCHQSRDFVNEGLYIYAVSVAVLHRSDCHGITLPPIEEVFPDRFVPVEALFKTFHESTLAPPEQDVEVHIEDTGNVLDPEYHLAYFREDVGINAHHWYWHVVYPATWRAEVIGRPKDRKGELFYYMHQQMCARYDCERLSNNLPKMRPFHNFHEPMEGYSAHLIAIINGQPYATRTEGMTLRDLDEVAVQDLERWRDRILDAIHLGFVEDENGVHIPLDEHHGTDILGNIIESSHDSVNKAYYGSIHNWGHVLMASVNDPDGRYKVNPGVMSDTATSLRDPIFYRWHRFIDDMFQEFKKSLHSYTKDELEFHGVEVKSVSVKASTTNTITTVMKENSLRTSHAFYFGRTGDMGVKYKHLDHEPFKYKIEVIDQGTKTRHATVRIFLGPKYDELGNEIPPNELRHLMIELDKFHVELKPGLNTVERESSESSVTIGTRPSLSKLASGESSHEYCSCGWPNHLLVPKGKELGMQYHLFVMLTDYNIDLVGDHGKTGRCTEAVSYCGAKDQLYPDKKAMGFPFDREIEIDHLEEWLTPNMTQVEVTIKHEHS